jgi:hypothetical protein
MGEEEIATALRMFRCEATIIAPAFPAMCTSDSRHHR